MDHEVSGKRHVRAGAVTVAELIERQPSLIALPPEVLLDMEIGAGVPQPRLAAVPERPRPDEVARPPSLRARILALTFGTIALLGAVSATAAISGAQPTGQVTQEPMGAPITGANALRPDKVAQRLGYLPQLQPQPLASTEQSASRPTMNQPGSTAPGQSSIPSVAPTASASPQLGLSSPQIPLIAPSDPTSSTTDMAVAAVSPTDVVRSFYKRLEDKSGDAQTLLEPGLLGTDLPGFQLSWQSVRSVVPVSVTQQPDGSVLGTVSVQQSNGSWLRLQQHFTLSDARPPLIDRVELISAQQS